MSYGNLRRTETSIDVDAFAHGAKGGDDAVRQRTLLPARLLLIG